MEEKEIVLKRARNAVLARDFELALRLYNTLLQKDSENPALLSDIGNLYIKAGDDRKAAAYFSTIIELEPENEEALNAMGGICRRLKEYDEAIDYLNRALKICKDRASIEYNLGFTYKSMGKNEEAIECFQSVINENPTDVLAYNHLGAIYAHQKEYEKAVSAYRLGLQVDPNHPILQFNLARAYESTGNDAEAIASYEAALRAKPGWTDAVKAYAKLLLKRRRSAAAAELIQNAVVLHPEQADLHYLLGRTFLQQDNYARAEENLEKARALSPDSAKILSSIAEVYENNGRTQEALDAALQAEKTDSNNIDLKAQTVRTLLSAKKYETACRRLKSLQSKIPNDVRFLDLGGQYSICVNHPERSKAFYARLEAVDPSYTQHLLNAAKRFRQTGKLEEAASFVDSFIEKNRKNAGAHLLAGKIAEERGLSDAALANYEAAARIDGANFAAKENTARVRGIIADEKLRREQEALEASDRENFDKYVIEMQQPEEHFEEPEETPPPAPPEDDTPLDFEIPADDESVLDLPEPEQSADDAFSEQMLEDEADVREQTEPEDDGILADTEEKTADSKDGSLQEEGESDFAAEKDDETQRTQETEEGRECSDGTAIDDFDAGHALTSADAAAVEDERILPSGGVVPENETVSSGDALLADETPHSDERVREDAALPEEGEVASDGAGILEDETEMSSEGDIASYSEQMKPDTEGNTEIPVEHALSSPPYVGEEEKEPSANAVPHIGVPASYRMNVKAQLSDEDALKLERTLQEVAANAEKAVDAAEKAWNAAQAAADSAQSADAAQQYMKEMSETQEYNTEEGDGASDLGGAAEHAVSAFERPAEDDAETPLSGDDSDTSGADNPAADESGENAYQDFMAQVSKILPVIARVLENKDDAKKYEREIALFKRLRAFGDILPEDKKQAFLCSRIRLLLDYLISRLSGKPGLLVTSNALRKTDVMSGMICDISEEEADTLDGKALVSKVFADLRELLPYLPDPTLTQSLMSESDKVVDKITEDKNW